MITRRNFIKSTAALGGLMFLPSCATKKIRNINGKMNIAVVGAGGMGYAVFRYIKGQDNVNVVAICDVDENRAAKAIKENPNVPFFRDYRVMFDKVGNQSFRRCRRRVGVGERRRYYAYFSVHKTV